MERIHSDCTPHRNCCRMIQLSTMCRHTRLRNIITVFRFQKVEIHQNIIKVDVVMMVINS